LKLQLINLSRQHCIGFRAKSIKTRIETNKVQHATEKIAWVLEQNPSKQGLKLGNTNG